MALNQHKLAISRLTKIIDGLKTQTNRLDQQYSKQHSKNKTLQKRADNAYIFSSHLFKAKSAQLSPYANEINQRLFELKKHITLNNTLIVNALISLLEQQIAALNNAINSNKITQNNIHTVFLNEASQETQQLAQENEDKNTLMALYQKLSEHNSYDHRLKKMISDRELHITTLAFQSQEYHQINAEIIALQDRLSRCQKAITTIEKDIRLTEQHYNSTI